MRTKSRVPLLVLYIETHYRALTLTGWCLRPHGGARPPLHRLPHQTLSVARDPRVLLLVLYIETPWMALPLAGLVFTPIRGCKAPSRLPHRMSQRVRTGPQLRTVRVLVPYMAITLPGGRSRKAPSRPTTTQGPFRTCSQLQYVASDTQYDQPPEMVYRSLSPFWLISAFTLPTSHSHSQCQLLHAFTSIVPPL
jgi:hypothetical protein